MSFIDPVQFVHDDQRRLIQAGQRYEEQHRVPRPTRVVRRRRLHLPRLARA